MYENIILTFTYVCQINFEQLNLYVSKHFNNDQFMLISYKII